MAAKLYITLKCNIGSLYDPALKSSLLGIMDDAVVTAFNDKSGGKFTTKTKSPDGYSVTVTLDLEADNASSPTKLTGNVKIKAAPTGSSAKGMDSHSSMSFDGLSKHPEKDAEELVTNLLKEFMPKVIKAMSGL